jgi:hypothetical protein
MGFCKTHVYWFYLVIFATCFFNGEFHFALNTSQFSSFFSLFIWPVLWRWMFNRNSSCKPGPFDFFVNDLWVCGWPVCIDTGQISNKLVIVSDSVTQNIIVAYKFFFFKIDFVQGISCKKLKIVHSEVMIFWDTLYDGALLIWMALCHWQSLAFSPRFPQWTLLVLMH